MNSRFSEKRVAGRWKDRRKDKTLWVATPKVSVTYGTTQGRSEFLRFFVFSPPPQLDPQDPLVQGLDKDKKAERIFLTNNGVPVGVVRYQKWRSIDAKKVEILKPKYL